VTVTLQFSTERWS